jgi:diguanylate cyclase
MRADDLGRAEAMALGSVIAGDREKRMPHFVRLTGMRVPRRILMPPRGVEEYAHFDVDDLHMRPGCRKVLVQAQCPPRKVLSPCMITDKWIGSDFMAIQGFAALTAFVLAFHGFLAFGLHDGASIHWNSRMSGRRIDWSARGRARVYAFAAAGTLVCIAVALAFDSYSFTTGTWRWGADPLNNVWIPLILAPPFFCFLLSKMRQLAIAHHELLTVASTDSLTSLLNRRAFTAMVDGYLERVASGERSFGGALLIIDVDHFKQVNDCFGHECGDEALKLIADTISGVVRDIDLVGRVGGEEFCVFIPAAEPERVLLIAERIRTAVNQAAFLPGENPHQLSVSIGGVTFVTGLTFSELYRRADQRLYSAKRNGRNRVEMDHAELTSSPRVN